MHLYRNELVRLNKVTLFLKEKAAHFGVNKQQECVRLLYEISKLKNRSSLNFASDLDFTSYDKLKSLLIKIRFPFASSQARQVRPYLPAMRLKKSSILDTQERGFSPRKIFVDKKSRNTTILSNFKASFPKAKITEIPSLKEYCRKNRGNEITAFNRRRENVFLVSERYDFFKKCPCTKNAVACGYHIFNLAFGCIFDCTYCYLQEYTNTPGIIFSTNAGEFFDKFNSYKYPGMRIGTGEFSDSLMCDYLTEYSLELIEFFGHHPDVAFEFKTKSNNIKNLLKAKHKGNIIVSWSLNPQKLINENEFFSVSLLERLKAAASCIEAGYKIGFHFDPVIYSKNWEEEYSALIELVFRRIKPQKIAWISIGTFRFPRGLKQVIEERFPDNKILDGELLLDFDNKLRYPEKLRYNIYQTLINEIRRHSKNIKLYLCMEEDSMWRKLKLTCDFRKWL